MLADHVADSLAAARSVSERPLLNATIDAHTVQKTYVVCIDVVMDAFCGFERGEDSNICPCIVMCERHKTPR